MAQLASFAVRPAPAARPGSRRGAVVVRAGACPFSSFFSRVAGARPGATGAATADTTLLARLGGDSALLAAVNLFYSAVPKDEKVARFFARTDMARLKEHQARPLHLAKRLDAQIWRDTRRAFV